MSREEKNAAAICMVHAQVRGTVAQSFGLSATTLSQHLSGTFIKRDGHTVFTEKTGVCLCGTFA